MPYNDKFMRYDYNAHRYILTADYLTELGIDVESRAGESVLSQNVINNVLNRVSILIYSYLYRFNDMQTIQYIIACCPSARNIIKDIMGMQALYMFTIGDLTMSDKNDVRDKWLDISAAALIDTAEIKETGKTLSNIGFYSFVPPNYNDGEY